MRAYTIGLCALMCLAPQAARAADAPAAGAGALRLEGETAPVALPAAGVGATVLVFVTPGCPMANRYAPALRALAEEFAGRAAFFRVYADPAVTRDAMAAHEKEFAYGFPGLLDPGHEAVRACGATRTPEVAVLDAAGALRYRGAVDDRYTDFGKYRQRATRAYLRDAIEAVLADKPVATERTETLGCFIPQAAPSADDTKQTPPQGPQQGDAR